MVICPIEVDMIVKSIMAVDKKSTARPHRWCITTEMGGCRLLHNTTTISLITNLNTTLENNITLLDHQWLLKGSNSTEHRLRNRDLQPTERPGLDKQ
jgi:hypothetical protein